MGNTTLIKLGDKLFETKIWKDCIKNFSLTSPESSHTEESNLNLYFSYNEKGHFEITTHSYLIEDYIRQIVGYFKNCVVLHFTANDVTGDPTLPLAEVGEEIDFGEHSGLRAYSV